MDKPSGEFHRHDNIDRDVTEISKDSLLLRLEKCRKYGSMSSEFFGYAGIAIALLTAAFLTERFHNIWAIPGETIRAAFLMGGIASLIRTGFYGWQWSKIGKNHTPETIVESLFRKKNEPVVLLSPPSHANSRKNQRRGRILTSHDQSLIQPEQKL